VNNRSKGIVIGASIAAAVVIVMAVSLSGGTNNPLLGPMSSKESNKSDMSNGVVVASLNTPPRMVLAVLKTDEDNSAGTTYFDANNTVPVALVERQHIRFESPDYRMPDSMKVIAMDSSGNVHILLKSYDVNNEFFINLEKGNYELKVQARWLEHTYLYSFNVAVN
jgi:hypothetical protein